LKRSTGIKFLQERVTLAIAMRAFRPSSLHAVLIVELWLREID
jgi:hypothetical protein